MAVIPNPARAETWTAQCIDPVFVKSREGYFGCGKCNFCLSRKQRDWSFRLLQEQKVSVSAHFLTLTYDDDHLVYHLGSGLPELCVRDLQLFKKRLRKEQSFISPERLRYYSVGEYGTEFDRPHYHSIMFNLHQSIVPRLAEIWRGGIVHVGSVTSDSVGYVTKYVINRHGQYQGREPPFAVMSRRPGLGNSYAMSHLKYHKDGLKNVADVNGNTHRLPRYLKDKIFEPWEKQFILRRTLEEMEVARIAEVQRLSKVHPHPKDYMVEQLASAHELIYKRLNEKNQL